MSNTSLTYEWGCAAKRHILCDNIVIYHILDAHLRVEHDLSLKKIVKYSDG